MAPRFNPVRLLLEALVIIGAAQGLIAWVQPLIAPDWQGTKLTLLQGSAFILIACPLLYWRLLAHKHRVERATERKRSNSSVKWAIVMTATAQMSALALTAVATYWAHGVVQRRAADLFTQHTQRIEAEVARRFAAPLYGLRGIVGTYATNREVSRIEFRDHIDAIQAEKEFGGIRGFGFIERVPRTELNAFIARERADSAPNFNVKTKGQAPDLYVIKFVEPLRRNLTAQGLDLGAEPARRAAVERAIASGEGTLSGRITLVQDGAQSSGFLYLVPIFRQGSDPATPGQRQRALRGLAYAPVVYSELLQGADQTGNEQLEFELYEGSTAQAEGLLYTSSALPVGAQAASPPAAAAAPNHTALRPLHIGGRTLLLRVASTAHFDLSIDRTPVLITALGGLIISFVSALAVWLLSVGRVRAQTQARRMTTDLARLAAVVRHTTNRVVITDPAGLIVWANHAYEQETGHALSEIKGTLPIEADPPAGTPANAAQTRLRQAFGQISAFQGELQYRSAHGREHWLEIDMQPLRADTGQHTGFMLIETDVSARIATQTRLETSLRDNDALLQALHTHAIVSITDRNGTINDVNAAFCRISGYTRQELLGQNQRVVSSGRHSTTFWNEFWHTISSGEPWRGEICNRSKSGREYWVDSMVAPLIGDDGFVEKYISIRTDITHIKAAHLALEQTTQRLHLAIDGGSDGLWDWIDIHAQDEWWSPQFYRLLGYEPDEIEANLIVFDDMLHPDNREATFAAIGHALTQTAPFDVEYQLRTKSGEYRWFRGRAKVFFNDLGEPQRMAGSIQDIHQRKIAEASLVETTTLLTGVLASATDLSVIATDPQLNITVFNRGAERLLGYTAEEMVHQKTPVAIHDPQEMQLRSDEMSQALGRPIKGPAVFVDESVRGHVREWAYIRKDGSRVPVSLVVTAILDAQGGIYGYLGLAQDISQRKAYETSLREARAHAEQASVSKSQFLANMSHEIRTPMNAILGMLRLLQSTPLTARQLDYAGKTESAARSLLSLLNDILDFSKVEAGKMTLDPQPFRIDRLLRDLSVILSANVGRKDIDVLFEPDPTLPRTLIGDSLRLQQVLINLGGNAIKFTAHGEVHIKLRMTERNASTVTLEFSVRDTGIGIAPENQQHIFSGFTQAEASTTRRFGGTGLGLVISQRLVDIMGGQLQMESALGVGTTFRFTLTLPVAESPQEDLREDSARAPLRVLVVDDNALARTILVAMCHSLGWQAEAVASGGEALARAATKQGSPEAYEAIFVDWQMPTMDGWETTHRLREQGPQALAPLIIMVTTNNLDSLNQRSEQEQALLDGFMVKPLTPSMLLDAVVDGRATRENPGQLRLTQRHSGRRLQGLRILVVEDNLNNQQVAQELLSEEGAEITLAGNGQEGVDAVARAAQPFDAVLMDLQMPVMDGYTATGIIRRQLQLTALPIIAMTANAMSSDRDACLAAGMNDHVGKPFDLDRLVAVLQNQTHAITSATFTSTLPPTATTRHTGTLPEAATAYAKTHGIELHAALHRMGNNLPAYARVLRTFSKDLLDQADTLASHLAQTQRNDAVRLLHTLKGMAGTVGLAPLARCAAEGERHVRPTGEAPTPTEAAALVHALRQGCTEAHQHLLALLDLIAPTEQPAAAATESAPLDTTVLAQDLDTLSALLRHADMQAMDAHQQLQTHHGMTLGEHLKPLDDAMASLDFPRALAHCTSLREHFAPNPGGTP